MHSVVASFRADDDLNAAQLRSRLHDAMAQSAKLGLQLQRMVVALRKTGERLKQSMNRERSEQERATRIHDELLANKKKWEQEERELMERVMQLTQHISELDAAR